jgi:hypothetical protein
MLMFGIVVHDSDVTTVATSLSVLVSVTQTEAQLTLAPSTIYCY